MEKKCITIASWNVDGLGDRSRKMIVKKWIKPLPSEPTILGIHELKIFNFFTIVALNMILLDHHRIFSHPDKDKGGLALLYHPLMKLTNSETLILGCTTWAQLEIGAMVISIAIIYDPSASPKGRSFLWHQLKALLPDGQWILMGDFNMTKEPRDSSGSLLLIHGGQLETWWLLKTCFDLVDAFPLAKMLVGTQFTRRATHGLRLNQSRLDRFYLSD